jgi:DNA-binding transcriptional ArsR family regulator
MRNRTFTYATEAAFSALADPTRRAVLDLLLRGGLPAGQIAQAFPVSRPAVSKHLRVLRRARLVRMHRLGRQRLFELNPGPLKTVDLWLSRYRIFWQNELSSLKQFVEAAHTKELSSQGRKNENKKHPGGKHGSDPTDSKLRRNR